MNNDQEFEITKAQRLVGNLIAGGYTALCGVLLLVVGLNDFGFTVGQIALPTVLLTVGLVFFTNSIIQKNTVSLWISFVFFVPSLVTYLNNFTALTYGQLYPLYIAIPAIASLFTMTMSRAYKAHLKTIAFFGVIAALFALQSSGLLSWGVVIPLMLICIGIAIVLFALAIKKDE